MRKGFANFRARLISSCVFIITPPEMDLTVRPLQSGLDFHRASRG
jgi:hypothetical protein